MREWLGAKCSLRVWTKYLGARKPALIASPTGSALIIIHCRPWRLVGWSAPALVWRACLVLPYHLFSLNDETTRLGRCRHKMHCTAYASTRHDRVMALPLCSRAGTRCMHDGSHLCHVSGIASCPHKGTGSIQRTKSPSSRSRRAIHDGEFPNPPDAPSQVFCLLCTKKVI